MQSPKVSVIIPVYNAKDTIGNILEKLTSQKYRSIEIIAVNDGSRDNSWEILQEFANRDKRIIAINQKNAGASAARNVGIENASGEFIMFVDSDDDISDRLIWELASHIEDGLDFIMCGMSINGKEVSAPDVFVDNKKTITRYILNSLLTKNLLYGPCCKLFRRDIVISNKIQFPEKVKYGEDTIFVLNYLRYVDNVTTISQVLYFYNLQPSGLASTNSKNIRFRMARVDALGKFMSSSKLSSLSIFLYSLLQIRWTIAFAKSLLRGKNA